MNPGTKKTHRYRHEALKTADLESRRVLALSFLALITNRKTFWAEGNS